MQEETVKAIYMNLLLLATADGIIAPEERQYLRRFAEVSGVDEATEMAWRSELGSGQAFFRPISSEDSREEALGLMARMLRVDGELTAEEQNSYTALGKALGYSMDELGAALRKFWNADPAKMSGKVPPPVEKKGDLPYCATIVLKDDMDDDFTVKLLQAVDGATHVEFENIRQMDVPGELVIFHAGADRAISQERLQVLQNTFSNAKVAFIVRRDQASQIGCLLEKGAAKCLVEPLYSQEIETLIQEISW